MKKVFVSYSHQDFQWVDSSSHTGGLQRETPFVPWLRHALSKKGIDLWFDHQLTPGTRFEPEIRERIATCDSAIILVSHDLVASDFVNEVELPAIRERVHLGEISVIPILVAPFKPNWNEAARWLAAHHLIPGMQSPLLEVLDKPALWRQVRLDILEAITARLLAPQKSRPEAPIKVQTSPPAIAPAPAKPPSPFVPTLPDPPPAPPPAKELPPVKATAPVPPQPRVVPASDRRATGKRTQFRLGEDRFLAVRWIAPGSYLVGTPEAPDCSLAPELPRQQVVLKSGFWMGETEVTQAQFQAVMGANPSLHLQESGPVEQVTWHEALEFCSRISALWGRKVALPTEVQWELACRMNEPGSFAFGDREQLLGEFAWYLGNANGSPRQVAHREPNAAGLHDMHGNVWEWTMPEDPDHPEAALRGGSYVDPGLLCRASCREVLAKDQRRSNIGFRITLE